VGARDRIVTDLPTFVSVAWAYPNPVQRDLVLLLLWSGLRMNEACQLRWSEVDLDAATLAIPAERMKAGRPLNIPLTRLALECLQRRAEAGRDSSGHVFPGKRSARGTAREGFATVSKAMLKVLSAALNGPTSPHDWRRTFTTIALNAGVPLQAVEVLTAHRSNGVTLQHYYAPRLEDLRAEVAKIDAVLPT
jgi:integrase